MRFYIIAYIKTSILLSKYVLIKDIRFFSGKSEQYSLR